MSDDIDRLKTVLEQLQRVIDTLQDDHEAMRDVVAAVKSVELETDPEGHAALRNHAQEVLVAVGRLRHLTDNIFFDSLRLKAKARIQ